MLAGAKYFQAFVEERIIKCIRYSEYERVRDKIRIADYMEAFNFIYERSGLLIDSESIQETIESIRDPYLRSKWEELF